MGVHSSAVPSEASSHSLLSCEQEDQRRLLQGRGGGIAESGGCGDTDKAPQIKTPPRARREQACEALFAFLVPMMQPLFEVLIFWFFPP
eukprot:6190880-Pleurochrysis_carterae.AAC.1